MRIIVIGDPHIKLSNFQEFDNFVEKLIKLIERKKPDIIVVLGDGIYKNVCTCWKP
jgi:3',5'-cyclic AMP phosphodiesterase CpdA